MFIRFFELEKKLQKRNLEIIKNCKTIKREEALSLHEGNLTSLALKYYERKFSENIKNTGLGLLLNETEKVHLLALSGELRGKVWVLNQNDLFNNFIQGEYKIAKHPQTVDFLLENLKDVPTPFIYFPDGNLDSVRGFFQKIDPNPKDFDKAYVFEEKNGKGGSLILIDPITAETLGFSYMTGTLYDEPSAVSSFFIGFYFTKRVTKNK